MAKAATPSAGTTGNTPKAGFKISAAAPPKIKRRGRTSPYLPDADSLKLLHEALVAAQQTDNPWISCIEPLDTPIKARIAMKAFKKALAPLTEANDPEAFASRVWETEPGSGLHQFAIAFKKGAK